MSSEKTQLKTLADFSPFRFDDDETRHILTKNSEINLFVVKSVLEYNCKRFRKNATGENFNLKLDPQIEKTHSKKR